MLLSDWVAHTPREVLAKNFGVSSQALHKIPSRELFIFQSEVPPPLAMDRVAAAGQLGATDLDFAFRLAQPAITRRTKGGEAKDELVIVGI